MLPQIGFSPISRTVIYKDEMLYANRSIVGEKIGQSDFLVPNRAKTQNVTVADFGSVVLTARQIMTAAKRPPK
jgi:hypothetical protein